MEDFLTTIFIIIFFFGGFILKVFKGYMEEIEKEKAHKTIINGNPNTINRKRKIGGVNVYSRDIPTETFEEPTITVDPIATSVVDDVYNIDDYTEKLRELEFEIKNHHKNETLSGDICNECYDYHTTENKITELLKDKSSLSNAIIMSEILSKPLSMRDFRDSTFFQ